MLENYIDIIVFAGTFVLTAIMGTLLIPLLRKLKFGQTVRENGPQSHLSKMGTPTVGGLIFLIPIIIASVCVYFITDIKEILPLAFVTAGFGFIGFLDDYLKIVRKSKDGLSPWQKMLGLLIVSVLFSLYIYFYTDIGTEILIWLFGLKFTVNTSFLFIPFTIFVLIATTNAVNLTDGLDGLASSVTLIVMIFFAYANKYVFYKEELFVFSMMVAGGLLGFLIYNLHPAKVFMGDTGSLALGGAVAAIAIMMKMPLLILLVGIIYVAEALSVLIQVAYFKRTKKRIFKMAPIHHHFEQSGWKETNVVRMFVSVTIAACIIAFFAIKL